MLLAPAPAVTLWTLPACTLTAGLVPAVHCLQVTALHPHRLFRLLGLGCRDASQDAQMTKPRMPSMPPNPVIRFMYVPAAATPSAHACSNMCLNK